MVLAREGAGGERRAGHGRALEETGGKCAPALAAAGRGPGPAWKPAQGRRRSRGTARCSEKTDGLL